MPKKIAIIGGGSATFTPQLIRLFARSSVLAGSTISLMDVDAERLRVMDTLGKKLVESESGDLKIEITTNQREALTKADFAITAIAVGGSDAYEVDIETPAKYGIFMHVCDSVGPGGVMRALRHIPVLVSVCKDLEQVSPKAVVINYANPLSANCLAMNRSSFVKTIGLCTCSTVPDSARAVARISGLDEEQLLVPAMAAGLNHCAGITELHLKDGSDGLALAKERATDPLIKWGLETYGVLPYCATHWTEFFPSLSRLKDEYQGRAQGLEMQYNMRIFDMEDPNCPGARARGRKWATLAEDLASGNQVEGLSLQTLPTDEGVQALLIMEALLQNRNKVHVVNVPNQGAIANLPDDAIVEVPALVNSYGVFPVHVGSLPDSFAAFLQQHIAIQEMLAEAALSGDRRLALHAFQQEPQVAAKLTPQEAERLFNDLMQAHARYLPLFN